MFVAVSQKCPEEARVPPPRCPTGFRVTAGGLQADAGLAGFCGVSLSLLRLFLVMCPHVLLCLDTLTTKSCEATTFQASASLNESQLLLMLAPDRFEVF